jgi:hypothetical protein
MVEMIRKLIVGLKDAGAFQTAPPPASAPQVNIPDIANQVDPFLKKICTDLAEQPRGAMWEMDFMKFVLARSNDQTGANLAIRDLQLKGLVVMLPSQIAGIPATMALTSIGWEIVRFQRIIDRQGKARLAALMAATPGSAAYRASHPIPRKPIGGQG